MKTKKNIKFKKKIKSISVIGCGRRVCQDVIASAISAGIKKSNIQILANKNKKILIRDDNYKILNFNNNKLKGELVYIAIPSNEVKNLIVKNKSKLLEKIILIDTPIIDSSLEKLVKSPIIYTEDIDPLLKKFIKPKLNFKKINFLFFYKSFYLYHGVSFIEALLGKIKFMINFGFFKIFLTSKGLALVLGMANYEAGNISFNFKEIIIPKLDKNDLNLIGGLTEHKSLCHRFMDLKRLGLREIFKDPANFLNDNNLHLSNGFFQYQLSKKKIYFSLFRK